MADVSDICAGCGRSLRSAKEIGTISIYDPGGPDFELCMPCWRIQEELIETAGTNFHPNLLDQYYATFGLKRPKLRDFLTGNMV